jgi:hypothetical protein
MHFGLGDAERVDTLIITWPSGHVDTYLGVEANRFYRVIEDSVLEINFEATNYIRQHPTLADTAIYEGETLTFDLANYYQVVTGDTMPESLTETLSFSLYNNDNTDALDATVEGNMLTLTPGTAAGISLVQVLVSAGFTERVDGFRVEYKLPSSIIEESVPQFRVYPNPVNGLVCIEFEKTIKFKTYIELMDISGKVVYKGIPDQDGSKHSINLTEFASGIYFLKVQIGETIRVKKVVKN